MNTDAKVIQALYLLAGSILAIIPKDGSTPSAEALDLLKRFNETMNELLNPQL